MRQINRALESMFTANKQARVLLVNSTRMSSILILIFFSFISCKNDSNEEIKTYTLEYNTSKKESELEQINSSDCSHPEYFQFEKYEEYCLSETIYADLNGNGILEKIYFDNNDCRRLIIEENDEDLISIGCNMEQTSRFPNDLGWANLWCVVYDQVTVEVLVQDGELIGERTVQLTQPSLFVGKEEAGGGIVTYRNGEYDWVHQSD
ncbi:hypothetical protein AAU57_08580 [Nonlabens sp. YIK11]|uniref:hypothetical protein n=1 Tax=Nonlabens sp. YIK11 TaxID=1453349 RepID=UPI0006DC5BC8|nr:hypothetical protein [Nonlabens sp. YIK11]KQC33362.1 hypothetical protein AAU57_08580 [Nonlabens sp. YIK11]